MPITNINVKFQEGHFFNDFKDIDPNLLTANKVLHKNTSIIIMMQSINNRY